MKRIIGILMFAGSSFAVFTILKHKQDHQNTGIKKEYNVAIDPILSSQTQQEVAQCIETEFKKKTDEQDFVELLVKRFPFIENVTIEKLPSGISCIEVKASSPALHINEHAILAANNHVLSKKVYQSHIIDDLFYLVIKNPLPFPLVNKELKQTIAKLSAHLFEHFSIVLHNETECFLFDKASPHFAILFNHTTPLEESLLNRCIALKNDIEKRTIALKKQPKKICVADVRFKNQIIVRGLMEVPLHG